MHRSQPFLYGCSGPRLSGVLKEQSSYHEHDMTQQEKPKHVTMMESKALLMPDIESDVDDPQWKTQKAGKLSNAICALLEQRKETLENLERRKARIRQNELTYADMMRRKLKLEEGLRTLEKQFEADEQQSKHETESAEEALIQVGHLAMQLKGLGL